jgi:hypothetical protein
MSESHFWMGLKYVESNPCRAGMVNAVEEYAWSSARAHLLGGPDRSGILDLDFRERAGGREGWAELNQRAITTEQVNGLRKCTYAGRPFGEEEFLEETEERFQRKWRRSGEEAGRKAGSLMGGCPRRRTLNVGYPCCRLQQPSAEGPVNGILIKK